jgi:threonine dehydrogenase-like Zn-dependent dehydrogenase
MGTSPWTYKEEDEKLGIFKHIDPKAKKQPLFQWPLGNMSTGIVTEVGSKVQKLKVGDRVFGHLKISETHTVVEDNVSLAPPEVKDEDLVCVDPARVALMANREGNVKLGETVAVFGLGAIGLFTVQMAKISGAVKVIGVEPMESRRNLALTYGADMVINPVKYDVGLEIYSATKGKGVDIGIDTSGSYRALHETIRSTTYGGTIVPVSWYHGGAKDLFLGEEWHFKRQVMVSGARCHEPFRDYPRWNEKRVTETVIELFRNKKLTSKGMLSPIVPFKNIDKIYPSIYKKLESSIKIAITYT